MNVNDREVEGFEMGILERTGKSILLDDRRATIEH
jgi:hypothetical protein